LPFTFNALLMQKTPDSPNRRKFVYGISILAAFAGLRSLILPKKDIISCGPDPIRKTHRMLTQDGTLVEVDDALLSATRKKITDEELQNWIRK